MNETPTYNELNDLCAYCDEEAAKEILLINGFEDGTEAWAEQMDGLLIEFGECKECFENN